MNKIPYCIICSAYSICSVLTLRVRLLKPVSYQFPTCWIDIHVFLLRNHTNVSDVFRLAKRCIWHGFVRIQCWCLHKTGWSRIEYRLLFLALRIQYVVTPGARLSKPVSDQLCARAFTWTVNRCPHTGARANNTLERSIGVLTRVRAQTILCL